MSSDVEVLELSGKQAAAFVGVGYRQFTNLLKGAYPPPRTGKKLYPSDELGQWVIERTLREHTTMSADGETRLDPQQENARKNKELADKTALENELRRGELIEASEVEGAWTDILARVRSRVLRIASSCAPLVMGCEDLVEVQEIIGQASDDALTELSGDWREDGNDNPG